MGNELVKYIRSSMMVTFKIRFKSSRTIGQSIEGIIENGKRYNKECKINNILR